MQQKSSDRPAAHYLPSIEHQTKFTSWCVRVKHSAAEDWGTFPEELVKTETGLKADWTLDLQSSAGQTALKDNVALNLLDAEMFAETFTQTTLSGDNVFCVCNLIKNV